MTAIAIIDDDKRDTDVLLEYIERFENGRNTSGERRYRAVVFDSGENFSKADMSEYAVVFLDIDMPGINGIETAKKLREVNPNAALIFITNMAQYAIDGYKVDALDFMLKPVAYFDFALKMQKVENYVKKFSDKTVVIKTPSGGTVRLNSSDILYVEVLQHYLTYHTVSGDHTARGTMAEAENELVPFSFCRAAKSYLVNLNHVTSVRGNEIKLGSIVLYSSRSKKDVFLRRFCEHAGGL